MNYEVAAKKILLINIFYAALVMPFYFELAWYSWSLLKPSDPLLFRDILTVLGMFFPLIITPPLLTLSSYFFGNSSFQKSYRYGLSLSIFYSIFIVLLLLPIPLKIFI